MNERALVKNAADPEQVKQAAQKEKTGRARDLNDLRAVLAMREGRRYTWRQLSDCGVFRSSFTGNSTTFFNEGRRDVGLRLLADVMEAQPEAFLLMQQEAKHEDSSNG